MCEINKVVVLRISIAAIFVMSLCCNFVQICVCVNEVYAYVYKPCCQEKRPPSTCYNLDIHDPITIIFGRNVTEKVRSRTMLCFPTSHI